VERIREQGCNQEFQVQAFTVHTKCKEGLIKNNNKKHVSLYFTLPLNKKNVNDITKQHCKFEIFLSSLTVI